MTKPSILADRIGTILQSDCPSADVRATLADANAELASAKARRAEAEAIAIDPLAKADAVAAADASIATIDLEQRRLAAAIEMLEAHLTDRLAVERDAERLAQFERAEANRDEAVEAIRTEYPAAVDALMALARRIAASDSELDRVNANVPNGRKRLVRAETVARGHKPGTPHPTIVGHMKLPAVADSFYYAYPRVDENGYALRG